MAEAKNWYVICYDITEPKRWRVVYKKLHGYGRRLQYSIFRCRLTVRQMERLHWELEAMLTSGCEVCQSIRDPGSEECLRIITQHEGLLPQSSVFHPLSLWHAA